MNDVIDKTLAQGVQRGLRLEALHRYFRLKYGINIELDALKKRLQLLQKQVTY